MDGGKGRSICTLEYRFFQRTTPGFYRMVCGSAIRRDTPLVAMVHALTIGEVARIDRTNRFDVEKRSAWSRRLRFLDPIMELSTGSMSGPSEISPSTHFAYDAKAEERVKWYLWRVPALLEPQLSLYKLENLSLLNST